MAKLTEAQRRALSTAAKRERGNICPTRGVHAAASDQLVAALDRRGFIDWIGGGPYGGVPVISQAGRDALGGAEQ